MLNVCHFRSIKVNDDFSSFEVSDDVGVSDSVVEVQGQGADVDDKADGDDVCRGVVFRQANFFCDADQGC